jgi:DNA (cytosine-5)-methyltransferase 1
LSRYRGIDLFCGGGGSSLGARAAGIEMVAAADGWDIAASTYRDNFPDAKVVNTILDDRTGPEIFEGIGQVDLLIASPECTHHSIARGAKPRDENSRRSGWFVMPFVRELEPRWVVLENVSGMKRWDGFQDLMEELSLYYHLRTQMLDAADFGVPQTRKRLFIMGDRLRKPAKIVGAGDGSTAVEILDDVSEWKAKDLFGGRLAENTMARVARGIKELGEQQDFLVVYYGSDRAGGWQTLDRPLRTLTTVDRFGLVRWVDGVATFRMLQVSELRRAMGYPDEAVLDRGSRRDRVKLLGNGVCPPVMQAVVESLLGKTIAAVEQPSSRTKTGGRIDLAA